MLNKLLRGAAGGLAGTLAHTAVMVGARLAGIGGKLPPKEITDEMLESFGYDPSEDTRVALAVANHVGFGASVGVLFGLLQPRMSRPKSMALGAVYGLAVWFASYEGLVPEVLGAMPHAKHDRWDRQAMMIAAHVAYGVALGAVTARPPVREPVIEVGEDLSRKPRRAARGTKQPLANAPITES
jgi:hypothetical protein